jgi:hypothetical protein
MINNRENLNQDRVNEMLKQHDNFLNDVSKCGTLQESERTELKQFISMTEQKFTDIYAHTISEFHAQTSFIYEDVAIGDFPKISIAYNLLVKIPVSLFL